jgi:hypothetical protein
MGDRKARDVGQRGDRAQDDQRQPGMAANRDPLALGEPAGLVEDAVGDAELADAVVEQPASLSSSA